MRSAILLLLAASPGALAQWHQGWNNPSRTPRYPPPRTSQTTVATIQSPTTQNTFATGGAPETVQTGGSPSTIQSEGSPETVQTGGRPSTLETGASPATVQTGQPTVQTNGNPSTVGPGVSATATGTFLVSPSTASTSSGAKGAIYNAGTLQKAHSLTLAWTCDWDATPDGGDSNGFVPQLWGPSHTITTADIEISDYVLFYNEPDNCQGTGGSCVGAQQTITDFNSSMLQFKTSGKKVSTPCVTNVGNSFVETFLQGYSKGYIDILCFHWYGDSLSELQQTVQTFASVKQQYGVGELWLSEMGVNSKPSDVSQYTQYLDGAVNKYAYNLYYLGSGGTL